MIQQQRERNKPPVPRRTAMTLTINSNIQRIQDAARNLEFVQPVSTSTTTSATPVRSAAAAQIPDDLLKQVLNAQLAGNIRTGNLTNLTEKLDSSLIAKVK